MSSPRSRVALVTGASSGIGRETAVALADAGFVTYATARRPESVADLAARGLPTLPLDFAAEASMVSAVAAVEAAHGAVDLLVNNAGYGLMGPLEELSVNDVRRQFETHVFGLLRMAQLVLPGMRRAGRGRIVNVGSVGGLFTAPGAAAYHMSKYAVESLTDGLRYEVRGFGVEVVLIQPTGVRTVFIDKQVSTLPDTGDGGPYAAFKRNLAAGARQLFDVPVPGLVVSPERVAQVIVEAAEAKRPRTRYKVGASAHLLPALRRRVSDRAWDGLMARQFPTTDARRGRVAAASGGAGRGSEPPPGAA